MEISKLLAKDHIDPETEADFLFISSIREASADPHCHEFAEIVLVLGGKGVHIINGRRQQLESGMLVFVRPDDVHSFERLNSYDLQFINLAFPLQTLMELSGFLGEGFPANSLLEAETAPCAILSDVEKSLLKQKFEKLNIIPMHNKAIVKAQLRSLLVYILTNYFTCFFAVQAPDIPKWVQELCLLMNDKQNFTGGVSQMAKLSGKSHEHLCRLFRKYFNITPTAYINELKLNYCANLLGNTDYSIIDICGELGFESLSHFYHIFKSRFGLPPADFRNRRQKAGLMI